MTQYYSLDVKLSNSQLIKLKFALKNETGVVLRLSLNMVVDNETNFLQKLLLTNRQVKNLCKAFANKSSTDIKLSKTQLSKMVQSGGFFGRIFGPLLKTGLPFIKNVIKPLAKIVLIPLGLTAEASAVDARIHKKILGSGRSCAPKTTTLIISKDKMKDIIEIAKSLEHSGLLLKGVSEIIQNEDKEQNGGFLSMLLGTLGASLFRNVLAGKGMNRTGEGAIAKRKVRGIVRASYGTKKVRKPTTKNKKNF